MFTGPDTVAYQIAPSRSLKVIEDHYGVSEGQLPEGRGPLILSSDFFSVYQSFSGLEGVTPLWCWAHIRRRFIRAGDAHRKDLGEWADAWVARISALYAAHRRLASAPEGSPQAARADAAFGAALDEIDAHRRIQGRRPDLLHPAAAKVLATLDREWDGLAAHREFPSLPLDNNTAERAIRTPVVGRKNYSGSGARWSADLAGHAWTILGTAKMAGLNPAPTWTPTWTPAPRITASHPPGLRWRPCCPGTSACPRTPADRHDNRARPAPGPLLRPGLHPGRAGGDPLPGGIAADPPGDRRRGSRRPVLVPRRRHAERHDRPRRPRPDARRPADHPAATP